MFFNLLLLYFLLQSQEATVMVPTGMVGNKEPIALRAVCEPSRVWAPALECRATGVEEQ